MTDFDCAVVGAGFVGATSAIALRRAGYRVLVIDGRSPLTEVGNEDVRGIALSASSRSIFANLDLWGVLSKRAMPIRDIRVSELGKLPSVALQAAEFGIDAFAHVIPADYLLRCIENKLLQEVKVCWRTTLEDYDMQHDHVVLSIGEKGRETQKLKVGLLIGADGVNSKVRSLANIQTTVREYNQQAIVATVKVSGIEPDLAIERFTPAGPIALLPSSEQRHVLVRCARVERAHELLAMSDDDFIKDITRRFARPLGEFSELGKRRAHPLVLSQAHSVVSNRLALLGAAAVTVHPNAAQGLNLGLRDVADLCACLAPNRPLDAAQATDNAFANSGRIEAQLDSFANTRRKDHKRVIRLTDGLARGFTSQLPGFGLARSLGLLATKFSPALRRQIVLQGMGRAWVGELPISARTADASGLK
ncbi:MAG: FAD-dependent monooxygenase [Gammaproteobacteria bacterium]